MGEEENKETKLQAQSAGSVPTQELSLFLKGKEPENADTSSSSSVRKEHCVIHVPKDQATSQLDQIPAARTDTQDSVSRDTVLAKVEAEKRLALIKAWEESEKTKVDNRAYKMHSAVGMWENSKKASVEAKIKINEEKLERKKAEYVEKMQNKIAEIHRSAEEKRAIVEAQRGEEFVEVEETASKFRTHGYPSRKLLACFNRISISFK
ncbi:remorin 1.4-like [Gastrolobium bilobum]|uniref:remorin 1.4-like n=1 Tax=Gastrolobium bilobum TaxID=150636 RepID=UPI002AB0FE26|nr:remorin 1.4-like [Gastrolobium bilobum]